MTYFFTINSTFEFKERGLLLSSEESKQVHFFEVGDLIRLVFPDQQSWDTKIIGMMMNEAMDILIETPPQDILIVPGTQVWLVNR